MTDDVNNDDDDDDDKSINIMSLIDISVWIKFKRMTT